MATLDLNSGLMGEALLSGGSALSGAVPRLTGNDGAVLEKPDQLTVDSASLSERALQAPCLDP